MPRELPLCSRIREVELACSAADSSPMHSKAKQARRNASAHEAASVESS